MADLTGLNIDANVEESTGGFEVIPAGLYKVVLVGDELVDTKAGTGKILKLKLQITEGPSTGSILQDGLNIQNPSNVAQSIGQGVLKRICNLCGSPFPPPNTSTMMGKPMMAKVVVEEFRSNNAGPDGSFPMLKSNKIKKYDPVVANQPPQQNQAPNQQNFQQSPNTGGGW